MAKKTLEEQLKAVDLMVEGANKTREKLINDLAVKKAQKMRLDEKKDAIKAEKTKKDARKTDNARKILLGAFLIKLLRGEDEKTAKEKNAARPIHGWLAQDLVGFLKTQRERGLFPEFCKPEESEEKGE